MRYLFVLSVCILATFSSWAAGTVKWTYPLDAVGGAATLYPNEQHPTGVVVPSGKTVVCVKGDGSLLWRASFDTPVASLACIADVDGDGAPETIVALDPADLVCLDAAGKVRWRRPFNTSAGGFKIPLAADIMPEPGLEIIIGFDDGWMNCVSAKGDLLWRFWGDKFRVSPPAVGDVDKDGVPEIVYGTDNGHIYCLSNTGTVKWRYSELAPYGRSGPNLADLDGDGKSEVLITRSNVGNATCLMALDGATGAYKWRTKDVMQGYVSNATVSFGENGKLETLHSDKGNWIYCVGPDGKERWRTELAGNGVFWAPAVADVDGDGYLEIVAAARAKDPVTGANAFVVGQDGTIDERLKLGDGANASPAIGDIDGDGQLEVVFVSEGPKQVQAMTWKAGGKVAWPSVRGNSAMTGSGNIPLGKPTPPLAVTESGTARIETGTAVWGENRWRIAWDKAAPEDAYVELSAVSKNGVRETRIAAVKIGTSDLELPWTLTQAGQVEVTVRLLAAGQDKPLFAAKRSVEAKAPDYCDFEAVGNACAQAIAAGEAAKADTNGIAVRMLALDVQRKNVAKLSNPQTEPDVVVKQASELRKQAAALRATADALCAFWKGGGSGSFVFWQDLNPWDTFGPAAVESVLGQIKPVKITAFGDEYEDVAITLLNITGQPIDVRCTFAKPTFGDVRTTPEPPLAKQFTLRRGLRMTTRDREPQLDALPKVDSSGVVTLAPGEARQVWLVASTYGLDAGTHNLSLYLGTLGDNPTFREMPIELEVWPVRLPLGIYSKINWSGGLDFAATSDQMLQDLLDHGVTVFYGPSATIPVDAQGKSTGTVDWKTFDAALARVPNYCQVLFTGPPTVKWPDGIQPKEGEPLWETGFATMVRVLAEHMVAIGWGYERWAFYPFDEPWNTGETLIPQLRAFCKRVKAADPKARNYADPTGVVRVEKIAEFKDLIDIWQPEMNIIGRDPALVKWFHENAKVFWAYEAPGPCKDLLPLGHYRAFAWRAWMFGCKGAGYWCYKDSDLWWRGSDFAYGAVYPGAGSEVVPSRRWEASRDGVEDYRAFYVLREEVKKAKDAGRTADAERGQALIDEAIKKVVGWQLGNIDEITKMTRDYELDFDLLSRYRVKIAQEIMKLRG